MRRRDFLKGVVGIPAFCPLAAYAQLSPMPVIGFLNVRPYDDGAEAVAASLRRGLSETGYVEGSR